MYIYEKQNKLNIIFNGDKPSDNPDVVISKEDDVVSISVSGEAAILPAITADDKGKVLTVDTETGKAVWAQPASVQIEPPVNDSSV